MTQLIQVERIIILDARIEAMDRDELAASYRASELNRDMSLCTSQEWFDALDASEQSEWQGYFKHLRNGGRTLPSMFRELQMKMEADPVFKARVELFVQDALEEVNRSDKS